MRHPGASTIGSQLLLLMETALMAGKLWQPSHEPPRSTEDTDVLKTKTPIKDPYKRPLANYICKTQKRKIQSKPKPSIWVTLGLKTNFRPRVSQIEGFGLLSSFSSLRIFIGVFVFKTSQKTGTCHTHKRSGKREGREGEKQLLKTLHEHAFTTTQPTCMVRYGIHPT